MEAETAVGVKGSCRHPEWVQGNVRYWKKSSFRKHESCARHAAALDWALKEKTEEDRPAVPRERDDVPSYLHFLKAYSHVKQGKAYATIQEDFRDSDRAGGRIKQVWRS